MQRRAALFGVWLCGTLVAATLAVLAVGLAGARVTSRSVPVVSRDAVTEELASVGPTTTVAPAPLEGPRPERGPDDLPVGAGSRGEEQGPLPPTTGAGSADAPGLPGGPAPIPATERPPAIDDSAARAAGLVPPAGEDGGTSGRSPGGSGSGSASGGAGSGSGSSPGGPPPTLATTTTAAPTSTRTITSTAGSIDVRCTGASAALLGTAPAPGYAATVISSAGQEVRVQLLDAARKGVEIRARCTNGTVVAEVR